MRALYYLYDPGDPAVMRHIGCTKRELKDRLRQHVLEARRAEGDDPRFRWIRDLFNQGILPGIKALALVEDNEAVATSKRAIDTFRKTGHPLTNVTLPDRTIFSERPVPDALRARLKDILLEMREIMRV